MRPCGEEVSLVSPVAALQPRNEGRAQAAMSSVSQGGSCQVVGLQAAGDLLGLQCEGDLPVKFVKEKNKRIEIIYSVVFCSLTKKI